MNSKNASIIGNVGENLCRYCSCFSKSLKSIIKHETVPCCNVPPERKIKSKTNPKHFADRFLLQSFNWSAPREKRGYTSLCRLWNQNVWSTSGFFGQILNTQTNHPICHICSRIADRHLVVAMKSARMKPPRVSWEVANRTSNCQNRNRQSNATTHCGWYHGTAVIQAMCSVVRQRLLAWREEMHNTNKTKNQSLLKNITYGCPVLSQWRVLTP